MNAPIRIAEIADWLHPRTSVWKAMALFRAYFDESGTHSGSRVTGIAGYVATIDDWTALEAEWKSILAEFADKGVRFFHMSECLAQEGQFARVDKPGINYIITQLTQIIGRRISVRPISSTVVLEDWYAVVTDPEFLARFPTPIDLCFDDVVRQLAEWSRRNVSGELVCPVFAYRQEYSPEIIRRYGAAQWYRETLGAIAFDFPDRVVPLQCADLIAEQVKHDVERGEYERLSIATGGPTPALRNAAPKGVHGHVWDAPRLQLCVRRFKETGEIYPVR